MSFKQVELICDQISEPNLLLFLFNRFRQLHDYMTITLTNECVCGLIAKNNFHDRR